MQVILDSSFPAPIWGRVDKGEFRNWTTAWEASMTRVMKVHSFKRQQYQVSFLRIFRCFSLK